MMNRIYVVVVCGVEVNGLISPCELLDLIWLFSHTSRQFGAKALYYGQGLFEAKKNEVTLTLTVGSPHENIPSRPLADVLLELMETYFQ